MTTSESKKTLHGPGGLHLVLDRKEIFPDDPGNGTPAMVYLFGGTSTYWCAQNEGEVDCGRQGFRQLTKEQCQWLNSQEIEDEVQKFLYDDNPDYHE